jgi:hypothetical protein
VLTWTAAGLLAGAVVVVAHWSLHRVDALDRRRPFPTLWVVLLAVLAGAAFVPVVRHARLEARLGDVASVLVGRAVAVRCQTVGHAFVDAGAELGYVPYDAAGRPRGPALIKRQQCRDLAAYARSPEQSPSRGQVLAVHVLTHEAMHLAGVTDEGRAECLAVQRDAHTARLLGAPADAAARLALRYWTTVYPRMGEGYRSTECRAGGGYDLGGADAPWR